MSQAFASFLSIRYRSAEWSVNIVVLVPSRYGRNFSNANTTAKNSFSVVVQFTWTSLSILLEQLITCCLLSLRYPKTAPMVKSEASHIISNGLDQSGTEIIATGINSILSFSHALRHSSSKMKGTSLAKRLVKGLAILLKFLMNLRQKQACPKKEQMSFMLAQRTFTLALMMTNL